MLNVQTKRCELEPQQSVGESCSCYASKYALCTVRAISPHGVNECCPKHLGPDLRLWCVSNDSAFRLQTKLSALTEM